MLIVTARTMPFSAFLPSVPDPVSRRPITTAAFLVPYVLHYVLAVLSILPHTFTLKVALFPIILWQAWKCVVERDASIAMANSLGLESSARLCNWNFAMGVRFLSSKIVSVCPLSADTSNSPGLVVRNGAEVPRLDNC